MARSALMNIMVNAALKAGKGLIRDFGEVENLQVSRKGPRASAGFNRLAASPVPA